MDCAWWYAYELNWHGCWIWTINYICWIKSMLMNWLKVFEASTYRCHNYIYIYLHVNKWFVITLLPKLDGWCILWCPSRTYRKLISRLTFGRETEPCDDHIYVIYCDIFFFTKCWWMVHLFIPMYLDILICYVDC